MEREGCDIYDCVELYRQGRKEEALEKLIGSREVSCGNDKIYEIVYNDIRLDQALQDCFRKFAGLLGTDQVKGIFFNTVCDFFEKIYREGRVQFGSGCAVIRCLKREVDCNMFAELDRYRRIATAPFEKIIKEQDEDDQ